MERQKSRVKFSAVSFVLLAIAVLTGCAKEETTKIETASNATSQTTIASDELTMSNEFDQAADDALVVICNHNATIPGALVDTSRINLGVIEIDYYGKETDGTKTRTGADSIHLPLSGGTLVPWTSPGTTITITLGTVNSPGYEVQFLTNNTSVRLNGTATLTNLSGGNFQSITSGDTLSEIIRGSLTYTFDDNAATIVYYPWNLNQVRSFAKTDTVIFATARGDTAINSFTHVSDWGSDRYGNTFFAEIATSVKQNISNTALSYNPLSGVKNMENLSEPISCTYAVNQQGTVVTSGTPYGFYISWVNNGGGAQAIIPYYF